MKRREFIALLGGAVAAWPRALRAQQPERMRRVGVLMNLAADDPEVQNRYRALEAGLRDLGWIDGRNLNIEYRWALDASSLRSQAAALVAGKPELILAITSPALAAAQQATGTLPIVFNLVTDPVAQGFIASLARPGGNSTGFAHWQPTMGGKWLEILKETAPGVAHVAVVFNPDTAAYFRLFLPTMQAAARSSSVRLTESPIHDTAEMDRVLAAVAAQPNGGLILLPDAFTWTIRRQIVALADRYRLPAIYQYRHIAREGGLVSYGIDPVDVHYRTATYIDRILNGSKPADLPVQLPTKFELVVNLKTAKALSLDVPPSLLARADEVIE